MPTIEELIEGLPVKGVDKIERPRQLSKAEIDAIRAEKKKTRTRHDWSNPAEDMAGRILRGAFGARNVQQQPDRKQGWQDKSKKWHYHWANKGKPDFTFAVEWCGMFWDGLAEVKSVSPATTSLDITVPNIKLQQIEAMDRAIDKSKLGWWILVFWERVGRARVFVIEHERFMQIIRIELPERAKDAPGNYMGRSLRRKADLDLIANCEVLKSNRWYLPDNHWFLQCG